MQIEQALNLRQVRIKTYPLGSDELLTVNTFLFEHLDAGWATVIGSRPHGDGLMQAVNQDGYLYLMKIANCWQVTADCSYPLIEQGVEEITLSDIREFLNK